MIHMPTDEQILEWNIAFENIKRVSEYEKMNNLYSSVCNQINVLSESMENHRIPKNPRQSMFIAHEKTSYQALVKQKERLERKLKSMSEDIQKDIKAEKKL